MKKAIIFMPYLNEHMGELISYLNRKFNLKIIIIGSSKRFRKHFKNDLELRNVIKIYSLFALKCCINAEIIIWHGIFYPEYFPFYFLTAQKKNYIFSESFNPLNIRKNRFLKSIICRLFSLKRNITLVSMGDMQIKKDYKKLGLKYNSYKKSGYFMTLTPLHHKDIFIKKGLVRFIFVGQFIKRKNIEAIADAVAALLDDAKYRKRFAYTFVGAGDLLDTLDRFKEINYIKIYRNLDRKSVLKIYKYHDVLTLPSIFDGWGAVVNEAASQGCALMLSNRVGASSFFLIDGVNGCVVGVDKKSILIKLKWFIDKQTKLKEYRANSLRLYNHLLNVETHLQKVFEECLN